MPWLVEASRSGKLLEVFGTGTAAVVAPVRNIGYEGGDIELPVLEGGLGKVARSMYETLTAIMEGRVECEGWSIPCV